ncbi:MAG: cell division protein FtsA [Bacteroidales bacterium]|nr:cell division protein FtsA [Bacteroidales bacterium]
MTADKYIAAIEISSSKIIGAIGRLSADGRLNIIAIEKDKIIEYVRYGIIQNIEETNTALCRIIDRLEQRASLNKRRISAVYVGLSGRSLRNIPYEVNRNLPEDTEITESIISQIKDEVLRANIDSSLEIIKAVPHSYFVNKSETQSPIGSMGNNIRASFDLIACRQQIKRNLSKMFTEKTKIEVKDYIVTPLSTAELVLSNEEKRLGCMLVDLGAETTTVSIYKNGTINYLVTLPLGSRNITRDITSLNVLEENAENIKTTSGNAIASDSPSTLNISGLKYSDISNLVVARSEEIVANIVKQISYAEFDNKQLPGGIIAVGGGFKLNGLLELLKQQSNLNVRLGKTPENVVLEDTRASTLENIQVISILYAASKLEDNECLYIPQQEELPKDESYQPESHTEEKKKEEVKPVQNNSRSHLTKVKNWLINMVSKDDDELN